MLDLLAPSIVRRDVGDGFILTSSTPLPTPDPSVGVWLDRWARESPERTFLAERDATAWRTVTYAEAHAKVAAVAGGLRARGVVATRPLLVLSDNSIEVALLELAALHLAIPIAIASSAYSLMSKEHARLRTIVAQLEPGLVYVDDAARYEKALAVVTSDRARVLDRAAFDTLALAAPIAAAATGPDTIAKILFTSGSTGAPKGVVNTQRMLTSNQESLHACWPFLRSRPPVLVDWLPFSHTFGSNHNFFLALRNGGSFYIDRGRPAPGLIETTLANMADVGPSLWVNVPRGFECALPVLEADTGLARAVFRNLDILFYAAAALRPSTRDRLMNVARLAGREEIFFTSSWGSTETAPLATSVHYACDVPGVLGVPVPGVSLKLARVGALSELRVKGPNVTPGFWRPGGGVEPVALDHDGFLPTGDGGRLVDEADPSRGVVFTGRIGENFKLSSGTWVSVGAVRIALVEALAPLVLDVVLTGRDCQQLSALVFLHPATAKTAASEIDARLAEALDAYNAVRTGASERVERLLVLDEPPSLDEGETTDKGYTNQRRVLERRAHHVRRLDEAEGPARVLR